MVVTESGGRLFESRRSSQFLGKPDEQPFRPPDVAEPGGVFVLHDFAAHQLCTALLESNESSVQIVDGEHDAQVPQRVDGSGPVIGEDRGLEKP